MKRKAIAGRARAMRVIGFIGFTGGRKSSVTLNDPVRLIGDTLDVAAWCRDLLPAPRRAG